MRRSGHARARHKIMTVSEQPSSPSSPMAAAKQGDWVAKRHQDFSGGLYGVAQF